MQQADSPISNDQILYILELATNFLQVRLPTTKSETLLGIEQNLWIEYITLSLIRPLHLKHIVI